MRSLINDNILSTDYLILPAKGLINEIAVLKDVRPVFKTDKDGNKTDTIVAHSYSLVDPKTFGSFKVKVEGRKPIVTSEEIELAENPIYVKLDLDSTIIKPYALSYGKASVSILTTDLKRIDEMEDVELC